MKFLQVILLFCVQLFFYFTNNIFAQGSAGSSADQELQNLIDSPTAGVLKKGFIGLDIINLPNGVLISELSFAPFSNFNIGISYGGKNIIGTGSPDFYKIPGINAKFRLFTETRKLPSFAIGFDNQGKGEFIDSLDRYEIKSPGIFICVTKNFKFLGYLSINTLINYTLENKKDDRNINFVFGFEKTFGPFISLVAEYDLGLNDNFNEKETGKGYLNLGIRSSLTKNLTVGFDFRDLLKNNRIKREKGIDRGLIIQYFTEL